jgi:hypothetical protein
MATEIVEIVELLVEKPEYATEVLGNTSLSDLTADEVPLSQNALRGKLKLAQVYLHQLSILKNDVSSQREQELRKEIKEILNEQEEAETIINGEESRRYGLLTLYSIQRDIERINKYIEEGRIIGSIKLEIDLKVPELDKVKLVFLYEQLKEEKRKQQHQNRIQQRYLKKLMKCLSSDADLELHIQGIQKKIDELVEG